MILLNWEGRKRVFVSCSELVEKLKISPPDDEQVLMLKTLAAKGETVYGCINPYSTEIAHLRSGIFRTSAKEIEKLRYTLLEEI